jgi:hypothetical protein
MSTSSIIIFGVVSAILLIFSCIIIQAPKLYPEFELKRSTYVPSPITLKETIMLRDRLVLRNRR